MALRTFATSSDERVIAGVCAGIAQTLGVDPTLVRLVFALLALAGGAGILLYLALWAWSDGRRAWVAAVLAFVSGCVLLGALGLSSRAVVGVALIAGGLALAWRQGGSFHSEAPLSYGGLGLAAVGAVLLLWGGGTSSNLLAPGAVAGALLLIGGPWVWRLAVERDVERTARIRSEERTDMAARVHDSVLQTLALVQRHAAEPRRVASLALLPTRELRGWLYGNWPAPADTLEGALAAAADDIEELHGVRVQLASGGDCPLTEELQPIVLAAREAMANAAKFSGADEISVYAEADEARVSVFVRDRGAGFDPGAVPGDRHGVSESIEGRMARAGGTAVVSSTAREGTEVELTLPLAARSEA